MRHPHKRNTRACWEIYAETINDKLRNLASGSSRWETRRKSSVQTGLLRLRLGDGAEAEAASENVAMRSCTGQRQHQSRLVLEIY